MRIPHPGWQSLRLMVLVAACLATWNSACSDEAAPQRPNVLLLVSDDQRPDTVAALGNAHIRTPHLDRLCRRGVTFRRAVCGNPICTPSRAEILSGCSGFRNGVLDFGAPIDPSLVLWPEAMRRAGYRTFYVGKWHNRGRPLEHGYQAVEGLFAGGGGKWWREQADWRGNRVTGYRGWVFQNADGSQKFPERGVGLRADISADFAEAAIAVLQQSADDDQPFFLHVNFTAPHDPLLIPSGEQFHYDAEDLPLPGNFLPEHPFDHGNLRGRDEQLLPWPRTRQLVRRTLAAYYSVITHLDAQVGRILAELQRQGLADNTLVIYTSDHGLAVGSHGLRGKQNMYEHTIGVPLIVAGPGISRRISDTPIYLRDLYPTVCQWCSVPLPRSRMDGMSQAAVLRGEDPPPREFVFGYFRGVQRMIRGRRWKLILYPQLDRVQLFDLQQDPDEIHDLSDAPQQQTRRRRLLEQLRQWRKSVGDI